MAAPPKDWHHQAAEHKFKKMRNEIVELHEKFYAEKKEAILIVVQGMDASGKDGLVRDLFSAMPAYGLQVKSFTKPTEDEKAHDFLWRVHKETPPKGVVAVFNRSQYEDVLIPYVYKTLSTARIKKRMEDINHFEQMLIHEGTHIIKLFLHISKAEQESELKERIDEKSKHWKHSDGDWDTRKHWNKFIRAYEQIMEHCAVAPWHIIPADHRWAKLYAVAGILLQKFQEIDPKFPPLESDIFPKV